ANKIWPACTWPAPTSPVSAGSIARNPRPLIGSGGSAIPVCLKILCYNQGDMLIRTVTCSLKPTGEQVAALLSTMEAFNAACDYIAFVAWEEREFNNFRLRKLTYGPVRERFGLPAQSAQQAIAKGAAAYTIYAHSRSEVRRQ